MNLFQRLVSSILQAPIVVLKYLVRAFFVSWDGICVWMEWLMTGKCVTCILHRRMIEARLIPEDSEKPCHYCCDEH